MYNVTMCIILIHVPSTLEIQNLRVECMFTVHNFCETCAERRQS